MELTKMKRPQLNKWIKELETMMKIETVDGVNYRLYSLWHAQAVHEARTRDQRRELYLRKFKIGEFK